MSSERPAHAVNSLPPGIGAARAAADVRYMSAAVLTVVAPAGSRRLLADVGAIEGRGADAKKPALDRLEATLGRDFADRLVAALSDKHQAPSR